jgi:TonB family protein
MAFLGPSLRRRKLRERPAARAAAAIALSLLANVALLALLAATGVFDVKAPPGSSRVALAPLSASQWESNRAVAGARPPPRRAEAKPPAPPPTPAPKPPPPKAGGQIVDVAPSDDGRSPPADTRFLADRDNRVEKETRSRHAGKKLWENTLPAPSSGSPESKRAQAAAPGDGGAAPASRPGREGPKAGQAPTPPTAPKPQERLALAPKLEGEATIRVPGAAPRPAPAPDAQPERAPGAPAEPGARGEGDGGQRSAGALADLRPDAGMLERIAGGPSPDRLDGVEEGEATALNTRGFRYATYIVRVNRAIYSNWNPNEAYQARDPEFRMFPVRDRTTAFEIMLDASGNLENVRIVEGSGLDFLDQEILRAVRNAAPFPNPPAGLLDDRGKIRLGVFQYTLVNRAARSQIVGRRAFP